MSIPAAPRFSFAPRRGALAQGVALVIALLAATPLLALVLRSFTPTDGLWAHLASTVLPEYVANSLLLALCVGLVAGVLGTATGWTIAMYRFPGRDLLAVLLLLPLAMPAYILAFTYTDWLQFAGPVQTWLRGLMGWRRGDYWFPDIRSLGGAIFVLGVVLYPYTYLLARAAFAEQSASAIEASRMLGRGPCRTFFSVALPLARPAIAAGMTLAVMEALADFGAVTYFGVPTFTSGIFRTWFALANPAVAAQLSMALLATVLAAVLLERFSRGDARRHVTVDRGRRAAAIRLKGAGALLAMLCCALPVLAGFVVPALVLVDLVFETDLPLTLAQSVGFAGNSALLALLSGLLVVAVALFASHAVRQRAGVLPVVATRIAMLGYATPGAVVAVGILIAIGGFDAGVDGLSRALFGVGTGLVLGGTLVAILYGHLVRFFAVAQGALDAGYARIGPGLDAAARTLGRTAFGTLRDVHLPLLRGSLLTAGILVFADVMKELPLTMILRPFNFETLAVAAYQRATTERLDEAALPALLIVLVGLVPVWLLARQLGRQVRG